MHSQSWILLAWGQSCAGEIGKAFSWYTAASRPFSSYPLKVLLSRHTCLLLVATRGERPLQTKIREGARAPGYGMQPGVAHSLSQLPMPGVIFK